MTRLRRVLGPLAAAWLFCQVGLIVSTAAVLASAPTEEALDCDCVHGTDVMCPMHHKSPAGARICLIGSADTGNAAVIATAFGLVGVLSPSTIHIATPVMSSVRRVDVTADSRQAVPPDPPPPRA